MDRIAFLRSQNYRIEYIWESDYRDMLRNNPDMKLFIDDSHPVFYKKNPYQVTQEQIIEGVMSEELFGFVEVDIQVPESWENVKFKPRTNLSPREYFKEMSPIFCNTEIPFDKIGKLMSNHAKTHNLSLKSRYLLVGGMKAEKILLFTPILKWYISHGMEISNIHQVVEYSRKPCFQSFVSEVTEARREGDKHESLSVMALLMKLIGNAAYGGTIINRQRHRLTRYLQGFRSSCIAVNDPRFDRLNEIDQDYYEAEFRKSAIKIDNPLQLGLAILSYAKLHMLSFYYDFMDVYLDRKDFEYLEVDTDSAYFALSDESIESLVKDDMQAKFKENVYANCVDAFHHEVGKNGFWFPRQCCQKHYEFDQREPGLMKVEFRGTTMIGLCSKSYAAKSNETGTIKYSLKGINNYFVNPLNEFEQVLSEKEPIDASNTGISVYKNSMYSYQQQKTAFTYFYCKRMVCEDGIHTEPLDICMRPVRKYGEDIC